MITSYIVTGGKQIIYKYESEMGEVKIRSHGWVFFNINQLLFYLSHSHPLTEI